MKFYETSEAYKTITVKLGNAQRMIESKINEMLANKNYGDNVQHWRYGSIVNPPQFYEAGFLKETKYYRKKEYSAEFRLRIDYEAMLRADEKEVLGLICQSIMRSVDIAASQLKIKDFEFEAFRKDLTALFKKEGWI